MAFDLCTITASPVDKHGRCQATNARISSEPNTLLSAFKALSGHPVKHHQTQFKAISGHPVLNTHLPVVVNADVDDIFTEEEFFFNVNLGQNVRLPSIGFRDIVSDLCRKHGLDHWSCLNIQRQVAKKLVFAIRERKGMEVCLGFGEPREDIIPPPLQCSDELVVTTAADAIFFR